MAVIMKLPVRMNLAFFFPQVYGGISINGQKYIYIRIACPVDVTVMHNGETLCSSEDDLSLRYRFWYIEVLKKMIMQQTLMEIISLKALTTRRRSGL